MKQVCVRASTDRQVCDRPLAVSSVRWLDSTHDHPRLRTPPSVLLCWGKTVGLQSESPNIQPSCRQCNQTITYYYYKSTWYCACWLSRMVYCSFSWNWATINVINNTCSAPCMTQKSSITNQTPTIVWHILCPMFPSSVQHIMGT